MIMQNDSKAFTQLQWVCVWLFGFDCLWLVGNLCGEWNGTSVTRHGANAADLLHA